MATSETRGSILAVILGASEFADATFAEEPAFKTSAQAMRKYLLSPEGLSIPEENLLDLFNDDRSPNDIDRSIGRFLKERVEALRNGPNPVSDFIFYYVGHGLLVRDGAEYALALRSTEDYRRRQSSYQAYDLAGTIIRCLQTARRFIILDCCYAALAYQSFQSAPLEMAVKALSDGFPSRGTALLCASSPRQAARSKLTSGPTPSGMTLFSECLNDILTTGVENVFRAHLTLGEVAAEVQAIIKDRYPIDAPRPEIKSPDERYGSIASMPLFPNRAFDGSRTRELPPQVVQLSAYAGITGELFRDKIDESEKLFRHENYEESREINKRLVAQCEALLLADPTAPDIMRTLASCKLRIANCFICLQQLDAALALLCEIADLHVAHLEDQQCAVLVEGLAQLGEIERSEGILLSRSDRHPDKSMQDARTLLETIQGRPPPEGTDSPVVELYAARTLADQKQFQNAVARSLVSLGRWDGRQLITIAFTELLLNILADVVFEVSEQPEVLSKETRLQVVDTIQERLAWLGQAQPLAPSLNEDRIRIAFQFYHLTQNEDGLRETLSEASLDREAAIRKFSVTPTFVEQVALAELAAKDGDLDRALATLPQNTHPWQHRFASVQLIEIAGNLHDALIAARELAQDFPRRAPIELHLSRLLLRARHENEARIHAQAAFDLLPGWGYRVQLAQCLLLCVQHELSFATLSPLEGSSNLHVVRILAYAAEKVNLQKALALWHRYLELDSASSVRTSLRIAQIHLQSGETEKAADTAWKLVCRSSKSLAPSELYFCAEAQLASGASLGPQRRERLMRVRKVVSILEDLQADSPEVEFLRFLLLMDLGFPPDAQPIDRSKLFRNKNVRPVSVDEIVELKRQERTRAEAAYRLYNMGRIGFESVCDLVPTSSAYLLEHFCKVANRGAAAMLCAPIGLRNPIPEGAAPRFLIGELEALLLHRFSLFDTVRQKYPQAIIFMFSDVWARLQEECVDLARKSQRPEVENLREIIGQISGSFKIRLERRRDPSASGDEEIAQRAGIPLLVDEYDDGSNQLRLSDAAGYLKTRGVLSADQAQQLAWVPGRDIPTVLPARLMVTFSSLLHLKHANALGLLVDHVEELVIGPDAFGLIQARIDELQLVIDAAELVAYSVASLRKGILDGWFSADMERPTVQELPDSRESSAGEHPYAFLTESLQKGLSYREALKIDSNLIYLTADFFSGFAFGNEGLASLAWSGIEHIERFRSYYQAVDDRVTSIVNLIRAVLPRENKIATLELLARLGFADAFDAESLLEMAAQFSGFEIGRPSIVLDSIERPLRQFGMSPMGAPFTLIAITGLYAATCCRAFMESSLSLSLVENSVKVLGARISHLSNSITPLASDYFMEFATSEVLKYPLQAFGPPDEQRTVAWSQAAPVGRFWTSLSQFASADPVSQASFARALRNSWLYLDKLTYPHGPDRILAAALLGSVFTRTQSASHAELEAPAILSSNWKQRPLLELRIDNDDHSVESRIQSTAARLSAGAQCEEFSERIITLGVDAHASEAVVLRMTGQAAVRAARTLRFLQGAHDGRAYELLSQLETSSADGLRRKIARNAVVAPWRLVRDDPAYVGTWHARGRLGFPSTLEDLYSLLSEPPMSDGVAFRPLTVLPSRLRSGGCWRARSDRFHLYEQAVMVPGTLAAQSVLLRIMPDRISTETALAVARLEKSNDYPTALIMSDIYLVVALGTRRPQTIVPGKDAPLGSLVPSLLASVLEQCTGVREDKTFADVEAGLLRLCRTIVASSMSARRVVSREESLWLTYRLFQWIFAQVSSVSSEAGTAMIQSIAARCLPSGGLPAGAREILEPIWFDEQRFNHRLAGVLLALATVEEVTWNLRLGGRLVRSHHGLDLGNLIQPLLSLTERSLSTDEKAARKLGDGVTTLGWAGPTAVCDLALFALIRLKRSGFFALLSEQRCRWFSEFNGDYRIGNILASAIVVACVEYPELLTPDERKLFLRVLEESTLPEFRAWGRYVRIRLLLAGEADLEPVVRAEIISALGEPLAPMLVAEFWLYVAHAAIDRLEDEVRAVCCEIDKQNPLARLSDFFASFSILAKRGGLIAAKTSLLILSEIRMRALYINKLQIRRVLRVIRKLNQKTQNGLYLEPTGVRG